MPEVTPVRRTVRRPQPGPGRPKDLEKKAAILEAAKQLFPQRGYDGVSMEAIAAEAGVSKLTVYNHFSDKENLFAEAVKCRCEELLPPSVFEVRPGEQPIGEQLRGIGHAFHALISSDEAVQLHRTLAARAMTDTGLAKRFYEAGPKRTIDALEGFLKRAHAAGVLDVPDTHRAAIHFFCLLKGEHHTQLIVGCCERLAARECRAHIDSVVDFFLRAYLPR
ncbi:TetR/AcrR family transcriptional regulator [Pseudomarimonas salicorniae]|uniref:TetR/AcrR family transcriptional regulator n=1 Tax=Pseudomarimonas salicorniae TaxID=2933270 RepID=A0ABT0GGV4_9GAMM|nr:TetR/AcrR family transcriptional regulator [Lysobacter sp. CAU 1642]MCK7593444.1 TetR/AcrR family transcriptional regulator [Lysobacter sp. CAU 1642]